MTKPKVALVLSGGAARGYAHIGAIEALEERGYEITSVAGCSIGALIGGMYCAGRLKELTSFCETLDIREIFHLTDWKFTRRAVLGGKAFSHRLRAIVPDTPIEDFKTSFTAIAADLDTHAEVVLNEGSLLQIISTAVTVPLIHNPVKASRHIFVDGGVANIMPLNRVKRTRGDILVAVNVNAPANLQADSGWQKMRQRRRIRPLSRHWFWSPVTRKRADHNFLSMLVASLETLFIHSAKLSIEVNRPDIVVGVPVNRYTSLDFDCFKSIRHYGYKEMMRAIDSWEAEKAQQPQQPFHA